MKSIEIYDRPMCCSTGVCGPSIDPVLVHFAADLDWLKSQEVRVDRFNLAQQPDAFVQNALVQERLHSCGVDCLPLIVVEGKLQAESRYPNRDELAAWLGLALKPAQVIPLVVLSESGSCSGPGCC